MHTALDLSQICYETDTLTRTNATLSGLNNIGK